MKYYFFTLHQTARRAAVADDYAREVLSRHTAYFLELGRQGKCLIAGPFADQTTVLGGGCYIFAVSDAAEAVQLADADPLVSDGLYSYKSYEWHNVVPASVSG